VACATRCQGVAPFAAGLKLVTDTNRHEAFTELLCEHHGRLFGYVFSLVRNLDDTHDVLQETCTTLWEKFDEYDPTTPFHKWAFTVARYKVLSHVDRKRRQRQYFNPSLLGELADVQDHRAADTDYARRDALHSCLDRLSDKQRSLIWDCYDGAKKVRQIADELDRTPNSVHNSLRLIRHKLMECIDRTLSSEDPS